MSDIKPIYSGEALLRNWSESASGKRRIILEIEDNGGAHPFKGYEGERFGVVIVGPLASAEHAEPVARKGAAVKTAEAGGGKDGDAPPAHKPKRRWQDMPPSQRAALLVQDPEFWRYLGTCGVAEPTTAASADTSLKFLCNIQSKRELDERAKAAETFERLCGNFQAWRQASQHGVIDLRQAYGVI